MKKTSTLRGVHRRPEHHYSFHEADDRIHDVFRNHNFTHISHEQRHQLVRFYLLLMQSQEHQNLTRLLRVRDVAIKHFIDCLMVPQLVPLSFPLLDVGTGPGFPGIPLKIVYPEDHIVLAEGVQKRVEFLKTVRQELKLTHLDIIGRNVDESFVYPVRGVITRAVEDAHQTLGRVVNSLQSGGQVFLMKGPSVDEEIKDARARWGSAFELTHDIAYELPRTPHQRRLLVYTKRMLAN